MRVTSYKQRNEIGDNRPLERVFLLIHNQSNKLVNAAANDSARISGQDRKIPPALGTNQIARFEGFKC